MLNDEQILERGGNEEDIRDYAEQNGANLTREDVENICPDCNGNGWISGSEAGHGCDGTEEDCARTCPIQIQVQLGCDMCNGTGKILPTPLSSSESDLEKGLVLTEK